MIFKDKDVIVFAGDSVTDMGSTIPVGEGPKNDNLGRGYVRIVESMLDAFYPEIQLRIFNSGISGDTSRSLLARFDRDVTQLNPDWVSICIGINDVWRQFDVPEKLETHILPDEYEQNIEQMIAKIKGKVKGIFILSPYIMEPCKEDAMRKRMDEYVEICRKLAQKHELVFVDMQKLYADYCTIRHSSYIAWDRIHPNMVGSTLMARAFLDECGFDYNHRA